MKPLELIQTFACDEDWDAMPGDRKQRHCGSCDKHLLDLSQFTEREAYKLAQKQLADGEFCAVFQMVDGRLVFRAETPNRSLFGAAAAVAVLSLPLGCDSQAPAPTAQEVQEPQASSERVVDTQTSPEPTNGAAAIPVVSSEAELPEACAELTPEEERYVRELEDRDARSELAKSTLFKVLTGPKPDYPLTEETSGTSFSLEDIDELNQRRKIRVKRTRTMGKLVSVPFD